MLPAATFGYCHKGYRLLARSRTRFAQVPVGSPFRAAASSYALLRRFVRRISSLWSSGSGMGGLPGPRLAGSVIGLIIARTNKFDFTENWVYSVRTVNQRTKGTGK